MCGFTGFALRDPSAVPDLGLLSRMAGTISHRGPDDEVLIERGGMALGFRRLSIIDVAGGAQPIWNRAGTVAVACNGEVYNFRELRRELEALGYEYKTGSDAESVLHAYEEFGPRAAEKFVGMFAFALLDLREPAEPRVVLGRDRFGVKPMYWAENAEGLWWGSEVKTLLASGRFPREARREALLDYLVQGYVGGPESAWVGIHRLPPATVLTWSARSGVKLERYWDLPTDGLRAPASNEEVLEWVDRAVADRLVSEVPLGAFLSGGIDSNAVATSMARSMSEPPVLCTVGFNERSHDELELARQTARALGAIHHTEVLVPDPKDVVDTLPWFFDEPLADPSTLPTWLVSRMARQHVTVALSGDGGDETFAGYRRYVHDVAENRVRRLAGGAGRAAIGALGKVYPKLDWAPRFLRAKTFLTNVSEDPALAYWHSVSHMTRAEALELLAPDLRASLFEHDPFTAFEAHYRRPDVDSELYRAQYADMHTWLPDRILAKVDRASMAVSLEAREPLLDHRLVGCFANLPDAEKVSRGRGKHRLREALRGRVAENVLDGQKRGFDTPLAAWTRGALRPAIEDAIETLPADWFDRSVLRARFAAHQAGHRNHDRLLWSLLVLEHWRRRHEVARLAA
ncbi:MAG: asparagine synthase (glutamine-hydrolyzing) [Planctomycetota bacterium]